MSGFGEKADYAGVCKGLGSWDDNSVWLELRPACHGYKSGFEPQQLSLVPGFLGWFLSPVQYKSHVCDSAEFDRGWFGSAVLFAPVAQR